jgi:hypothetical protein
MRRTTAVGSILLAGLALAGTRDARALDGWLKTRDEGLSAARTSGKPVLVVTIWPGGV